MTHRNVRPFRGFDPVFRDPAQAISWRSPRQKDAEADSIQLNGRVVAECVAGAQHLGIELSNATGSIWLVFTADISRVLWHLQPFPPTIESEETFDSNSVVSLDWGDEVTEWKPMEQIAHFGGRRFIKLSATNSCVLIYIEGHWALRVSAIGDIDKRMSILFYAPDL